MTICSAGRRCDGRNESSDLCLVCSMGSCCRTAALLICASGARKVDRVPSTVESPESATASDLSWAPSSPGGAFNDERGGVLKGRGMGRFRSSGGGVSTAVRRQARS